MVEGGSPNTLLRRGANKNSFLEGTVMVVDGYQAATIPTSARECP